MKKDLLNYLKNWIQFISFAYGCYKESSVEGAYRKLPRTLDGFIYVSGVYWHMSASSWDREKAEEMVDVNLLEQ